MLIAGIIYSRPVLDNSLTSSHKLFSQAMIIMIIMKSFISDPEQVRVTFFQSYIHYRYKKLFFTVFEYILWDIL